MADSATANATATANLVGNAFVVQYYNVLHQSPHVVHRFYTDQSKLSRAEVGEHGEIIKSQDKIREKIMSMNFEGCRAEIKTVDSQESLNGSVFVMVTGSLSTMNGPERNFVQTFFLAPQERGYFVLNDIFRYLNGESAPAVPDVKVEKAPEVISTTEVAEEEHQQESAVPAEEEVELSYPNSVVEDKTYTEDHYEPPEQEDVVTERDIPAQEPAPAQAPILEVPIEQPVEQIAPPVEEEIPSGTAKLSYASILRARSEAAAARPAPPRKVTPPAAAPVAAPAQVPQTGAPAASRPALPEENVAESGGDGKSVYAKNLPLNITLEELEKEFQKFGALKPGGVNLRNQKAGVCFAFIEFEDISSAQSAIEASPITIGGRQIYIEEKKVTTAGPTGGRGRPNQGRGYQNDGRGRGRGDYADRDANGRGRGGRGYYRGGGGGGNPMNGYRRSDNQTGNGQRRVAAN